MDALELAYLRARQETVSFVSLRRYTGGALCRDPRDKIYSTLGIMNAMNQSLLRIQPSYTSQVSDVYTAMAQRIYSAGSCLDLLEACELSSRSLTIPSWVPDWSTPLNCEQFLPMRWSACAWITGPSSFDESGLCFTVTGISIAQITELDSLSRDTPKTTGEVFEFLRRLRPSKDNTSSLYMTGETFLEAYCRTFIADNFRNMNWPGLLDYGQPDLTHSQDLLNLAWSDNISDKALEEAVRGPKSYFHHVHYFAKSRRLLKTLKGHIGLTPLETQAGDILCVLFGSRHPVILRPTAAQAWIVVGHCYAHDLMDEESVYRDKHAARYQSRRISVGGTVRSRMDFLNLDDGMLNKDFAGLLEETGVKVEREQDEPPALFVQPETLRAAGLQVQDFVLV